ncbi:MAG TPA: PAS domain-containing protein, partial [Lachnospiraceae bacterium]
VIEIVNGFHSGRKIGSPITNFALSMLSKIQNTSDYSSLSYFNRNSSGVILKSTTIPILGEQKRIIGLLCINFYTDTPLSSILGTLLPEEKRQIPAIENRETFSDDVDELILSTLEAIKGQILNDPAISTQNKNKEIIASLYTKGIFNLKDSVSKIANFMNLSKNTVYMHLRNLKNGDSNT